MQMPKATTDSAVELTSPPMQRPSVRFSDNLPSSSSESEHGQESSELASQQPPPDFSRQSVPAMLTAAEVEMLPAPFQRTGAQSLSKRFSSAGVDMYLTEGDAASPSSTALGAPRKSVNEAFDDVWS